MEKVKVLYNTLVSHQWTRSVRNEDRDTPYYGVYLLLRKTKRKAKTARFFDLSGGKFMFLETLSKTDLESGKVLVSGVFKSARNQFRPNLINKTNGTERENPKLMTEGDIEKTHFAILIDRNRSEVFYLMEYNYHGVTVNNFIAYLKHFNRLISREEDTPVNFVIQYNTIPKDNFIQALRALNSVKIAEVTMDKTLLGSSALNFSNRLISVKNELKLTISSSPRDSIKETAVDLFNNFNGQNSGISKVRVKGKDDSNNDVLLDTSFMNKIEYINVEKNEATGELQSAQIFTGLRNLIQGI